ncbi:MAG: hypothetical protein ABIH64_07045 [Nanoarchaeota archaeon]
MRASNYRDHRTAYTPWNHAQMVRAALVEGIALRPDHEPTEGAVHETQRYRRLLKEYTVPGLHDRIDHAYDILRCPALTDPQKAYVYALLRGLENNDAWVPFRHNGHEKLRHEGVEVVCNATDIDGVVNEMYHTDETKVVVVDLKALLPDVDLWKHARPQNRLLMNGKLVINHFAAANSLALPDTYRRSGYAGESVTQVLHQSGFTFNASFEHCAYIMQENPNLLISMFVIKNGRDSETRFFPISIIGGHELYLEVSGSPTRTFSYEHRKAEPAFNYRTVDIKVPRRMAFGPNNDGSKFDIVRFTHIRHLQDPNRFLLEWTKTRTHDNCHSAHDLIDFEPSRAGDYYIGIFDEHARAALEYLVGVNGELVQAAGYSLMIYATKGYQRLVDRFRYNLSDGSSSVGQRNISLLATQSLRKISEIRGAHPFRSLFQENPLPREKVLKPRFLVRQRHKLRI